MRQCGGHRKAALIQMQINMKHFISVMIPPGDFKKNGA